MSRLFFASFFLSFCLCASRDPSLIQISNTASSCALEVRDRSACDFESGILLLNATLATSGRPVVVTFESGLYLFEKEIVIENADVSFTSLSTNSVVFDGQWKTQLLLVTGSRSNVSFSGIHFRNGGNLDSVTSEGSAVVVEGQATVKFSDCEFSSNIGVVAGGIRFFHSAPSTIINSRFTNNTAIYSRDMSSFFNKTDYGFQRAYGIDSDNGGIGGAVTIMYSIVDMISCVFTHNAARTSQEMDRLFDMGAFGGAVGVFGKGLTTCVVKFYDCLFEDNVAEGVTSPFVAAPFGMGGCGGALHISDSFVELFRVIFRRNYATGSSWSFGGADGGAVFIRSNVDPSYVFVRFVDNIFEENVAYGTQPSPGVPPKFLETAGGEGAAVMVLRSRAGFERCLFVGNLNDAAKCQVGDEIMVLGRSTVGVASTPSTAGLHVSTAYFDECIFRNNFATSEGLGSMAAAIGVQIADVNVSNSIFENNVLYNALDPRLVIPHDPRAYFPSYEYSYGAAIFVYAGGKDRKTKIWNTIFVDNTALGGRLWACGGGVAAADSALWLTNVTFDSNSAQSSYDLGGAGGALCLDSIWGYPSSVIAKSVAFTGNFAAAPLTKNGTGRGGAVALLDLNSTFTCDDCLFRDNSIGVQETRSSRPKMCASSETNIYDPNKNTNVRTSTFTTSCRAYCSRQLCTSDEKCNWRDDEGCYTVVVASVTRESIILAVKENKTTLIFIGIILGVVISAISVFSLLAYKRAQRNKKKVEHKAMTEDDIDY